MALITGVAVGCILALENGFRLVICFLLFVVSCISLFPVPRSPVLGTIDVLGKLAVAIGLTILICSVSEFLSGKFKEYEFNYTAK